MYILYVDESGDPDSWSDQDHFVLAGVAVFEGEITRLSRAVDRVQENFFPTARLPIEFHASRIFSGKGRWGSMHRHQRMDLLKNVYSVVRRKRFPDMILFGTAVHISYPATPEEALRAAFEDICGRFNIFFVRQFNAGHPSKGLLVLDRKGEASDARYREMLNVIRLAGVRLGYIRNIVDIPYSAQSHHSRLIQLADFVAYAIYRYYDRGDRSFLDIILDRFDRRSPSWGPEGLSHLIRVPCRCIACKLHGTVSSAAPSGPPVCRCADCSTSPAGGGP